MNEAQLIRREGNQAGKEGFRFVDAAIVLAKHKKIVLGIPVLAALIAAAVSLVLPSTYKATTKLLPPQQSQSSAGALLSQLGATAAGVAGIKNPSDMYIGMLKSRTVADRLIAKYKLKEVYGTDSQETARKDLESNTAIAAGKDGIITIEVEDKNQKLVAPLTNGYVEELLRMTRVLAVTEASQRRLFYEQQLELAKNNLAKAEANLKGALDTTGVISVDTESRAVMETMARLTAQISNKEIQLKSMSAFVTASNPEYRRVEEELNSLRSQLSSLENGRADSSQQNSKTDSGPSVKGMGNIKLLRDVKYYQMLYEMLAKQYEVARLDEAKDPALIQVMDPAIDPERRFKPRRTFIVILSTMLGLFCAVAYAFASEARKIALMAPEELYRWEEFKKLLRKKQGA
jgi:uncharacterized protein involved in exopolysaccharide biosynthesis